MAHGFSAVKEMYLDDFAEAFAAAGLNALVFDNRNFGASEGEPRLEIDPWGQVRDYRHAITYATTLDEVDATRIGVWGTGKTRAPSWRNEVTLRTVEMLGEYEPGTYIGRISPTPLLLIVARQDHLTPAHLAIDAFENAREPKQLVILPGGHFDAYVDGFAGASGPARDFFVENLG